MTRAEDGTEAGPPRLAIYSQTMWRDRRLRRILALCGWRAVWAPLALASPFGPPDAVAGWGHKPSARRARRAARRIERPYIAIEDGFLRSVGLGVRGEPALSLMIDPVGVYYDASGPSAIETRLSGEPAPAAELERARRAMARLREDRLSKYNDAVDRRPADLPSRYVLVVDQTRGDASIAGAGATEETFGRMLRDAVAEAGDLPVVVKTHPAVTAGAKSGHFGPGDADGTVRLCAEAVNPWALLDDAARVYVVSSQLGCESLVAEKTVRAYGRAFYTGWGLTEDRIDQPARRRVRRSVEEIVAAAYLHCPVYYDSERDRLTEFEQVAQYIVRERARRLGAR